MRYRVHMSCWDGVKHHYYTVEVEGKDKYDAAEQARIKYVNSEDFPARLSEYSFENKIEEPTILWIIENDNKHLYPDDFDFTKNDWSGNYVSFFELCNMIDCGAIIVDRDKLKKNHATE